MKAILVRNEVVVPFCLFLGAFLEYVGIPVWASLLISIVIGLGWHWLECPKKAEIPGNPSEFTAEKPEPQKDRGHETGICVLPRMPGTFSD